MKNRNRFVVGICYLVVALLLIGASGCPIGNFSGITISGKVTDANGDAVKGATVRTTPTTEIVKTDETGYYAITGVFAGQYTFKVSKAGYKTKTEEVTVGQMDALSCNGGVKRINLELEQELDETGKPKAKTGGIEGTITDAETGRGIQGGTVTTEVATKEVNTDTNGKYAIDEVSAGAYAVKVKKSGYYEKTVAGQEVVAGSVTTVDVKMVKVAENKGVISGRVTSDTGASISGATITTSPATSEKTTDASGNYEITDVSAGDYTITAVKTRFTTKTKSVTVRSGESADGNMTMSAIVSANSPNEWTQLNPGGTPPSTRTEHSAVWDTVNNRMLVFGGMHWTGTWEWLNDLWSYDGDNWTQIIGGTTPSARIVHSAVWDSVNNRMLLFGGKGASENFLNELWGFAGTSWAQLTPGGTPPSARYAHSAVWDSLNNRMLVFGGTNGSSSYNDLWSYNGTNWTQLNPGGTPPSPRYSQTAVWDSQNNRMLIFGGVNNSGVYLGELWSYDGSNWSQLTGIAQRQNHSAVWDLVHNRMLIFGGYLTPSGPVVSELWSFDGANWTNIVPTGTLISAHNGQSAVWDTQNNRMLVFAGNGEGPNYNDLWSYK